MSATSVDILALSMLSELSHDGALPVGQALQALYVNAPVDVKFAPPMILSRLAEDDLVTFVLDDASVHITPAGCDALVLFETRTILMLAESEMEEGTYDD